MSLSFAEIPTTFRVPGVWAEIDGSQAVQPSDGLATALLIGQVNSAGTMTRNTPTRISSPAAGILAAGRGSPLARMITAWFANNQSTELWVIGVADNGAGVAATGTITWSGTSTAAGTISLYVAGQLVEVAIPSGTAAAAVGPLVVTAANLVLDLPATASGAAEITTFTADNKGTAGNYIDLRLNYLGPEGGEALPAGITAVIVAMASGATDPVLTTAITNMGDERYDFVATHLDAATPLTALQTEISARWGYARQQFGGLWLAKEDTVSNLQSWGAAENHPYTFVAGYEDSPTPPWEVAAAVCGRAAQRLTADPARPLTGLEVTGMLPPPAASKWLVTERNSLLQSGIGTLSYSGSTCRIERIISTYVTNAASVADSTWLDPQTPYTLAYVLRSMKSLISTRFGSHKLADDGTRFGPGQLIATPSVIRSALLNQYATWEGMGLVENATAFDANLIVERNALDPNRVDILFPPDLINQCRTFAILGQFRLQYPAPAE